MATTREELANANFRKVKAAAASHTKRRAMNREMPYLLWGGGSLGSIVVACLWLALNPNQGPGQTTINDRGLIEHINRNARTWRAGASQFFAGWTKGDLKARGSVGVSSLSSTVTSCMLPPNLQVPERFDARERWPRCLLGDVYNMGNCSASWAVAAASALSNRFCISDPEGLAGLRLSPQQLLSCDRRNRGCSGGDLDTVWSYMQRDGLVSEACFPYEGESSVDCSAKCNDGVPLKAATHCAVTDEASIRREIYANGPVVAPLFLMDDFLVYKAGLYQELPTAAQLMDGRQQRMIHAVKIIGWGAMSEKRYWLIENNWGADWGEQGYAKVLAGGDPDKRQGIVAEGFVLAGTPASRKLGGDVNFGAESDMELDSIENQAPVEHSNAIAM